MNRVKKEDRKGGDYSALWVSISNYSEFLKL